MLVMIRYSFFLSTLTEIDADVASDLNKKLSFEVIDYMKYFSDDILHLTRKTLERSKFVASSAPVVIASSVSRP